MNYNNTHFTFLEEDLYKKYGVEKGKEIYEKSCIRLSDMLEKADYRNNESIKIHITKNMYPTIAYYLTLKAFGYTKEEALEYTSEITKKAASIQKDKNKAFGSMPFAYSMFKMCTKGIMKKMYPQEGWDTEWVTFDKNEIHMNFHRCIYVEMTKEFNCTELCPLFCDNDLITFSGYEPKIQFERSGTIAEGASCCDFHFKKGL